MKLRLVHAETVDFRQSEATNIDRELKRAKLELHGGQCALLINHQGNQFVLVRAPTYVELETGHPRKLYVSVRFRLDGGAWWQNLGQFFAQVEAAGVDCTGLRRTLHDYAEQIGKTVGRSLRAVA